MHSKHTQTSRGALYTRVLASRWARALTLLLKTIKHINDEKTFVSVRRMVLTHHIRCRTANKMKILGASARKNKIAGDKSKKSEDRHSSKKKQSLGIKMRARGGKSLKFCGIGTKYTKL